MAKPPLFQEPVPVTSNEAHSPTSVRIEEPDTQKEHPTARLLKSPSEGVPEIVSTDKQLREVTKRLAGSEASVALDTERAQGHRYGGGAYLVQIRKSDVGSFLIDPTAFTGLGTMKEALKGTWILHAADQDLKCMADLGLVPEALFDTEVAAKLLGYPRFSLGALTESVLGIALEKSHQNEDWSLRPLPLDWLRYAALDVELLPQLREKLEDELFAQERQEWAQQEFEHELSHPLHPRVPHWRDLKGLGKVRTREGLAIARELWLAREELGRETDVAPGRILSTQGIVEAAVKQPSAKSRLASIDVFRRPRARREMERWWDAIASARALTESQLPELHLDPDPEYVPPAGVWKRADPEAWVRLQAMRSLAASAAEPLGLLPEVVLEPRVQRQVAWHPLQGPLDAALLGAGARPWQVELIGAAQTKQSIRELRK